MPDYTNLKEQLISQVPLFASLPREEIQYLAQVLRPHEIPAGTLLFKEGERGDRFYVLLDGQMEIIKALGTPDERLLAVRNAGTFIGEMSLMNVEGLRTASVRSCSKATLLEMRRVEFDDLLQRRPILAYNMVRVLSQRLDEAENITIRELREKNIQLTQAYRELQAAQAQIIEKERLERELEVAREIQFGILPSSLPQCSDILFDASIVPTSAVGGDFYDVIPQGEDTYGIAVGDVSDHGVHSALFMALTVTLLRAEARRMQPPQEVLLNVNRQLLEMNETNMFVTVLYGVLDCATGKFDYVRAGHELPIVIDREGRRLELAQSPGMPLGLFDEPSLDIQTIALGVDDTLLLYSDGATDAQNPQGELLGKSGLQRTLEEITRASRENICQRLMASIQEYSGESTQNDDITLLSARIKKSNS